MRSTCLLVIIAKKVFFFRRLFQILPIFDLFTLLLLCLSLILQNVQAKVDDVHLKSNSNSNVVPKNYTYFIESLDELAYSDLLVAKAVLRLNTEEIQSSKLVQKYLNGFEQASDLILKNSKHEGKNEAVDEFWLKYHAQEISNNAISAYKLISRTAQYWPKLFKIVQEPDWPVKILSREEWPTKKDVIQAANAILDLQVFYSFNVSEFSEGNIMGISTGVKLSVQDCLDLGLNARRLGYYAQSIEWLQLVQEKLESMKKTGEKISSSNKKLKERADKYLTKVIDEHDVGLETGMDSLDFWDPKFFREPLKNVDPSKISLNKKTGQRKTTSEDLEISHMPVTQYNFEHYRHLDLCRGKNFQTEAQKSRLFCWQEFQIHKQYLIGPLKMEFLSRDPDPDVVRIYEALSNSTIEKINKLVSGRYTSGTCPTEEADILEPKEWATEEQVQAYYGKIHASTSRVPDNKPQYGMEPYVKNVEAMFSFKLSTKSAEALRLIKYTFASVYKLHYDTKAIPDANTLSYRLATLLYYLSDVQAGGQTVFPKLGFAAKAIKGSIVLFFNLHGNDEYDRDLMHGGCPPLLGRKHLCTKWIRTYGQVQNYPCPLHPKQRFRVKVNGK